MLPLLRSSRYISRQRKPWALPALWIVPPVQAIDCGLYRPRVPQTQMLPRVLIAQPVAAGAIADVAAERLARDHFDFGAEFRPGGRGQVMGHD